MSSPDEIAASLTRIYRLFVDIGYLSEADLKLAPHGPEELRADLCRQVGMNATAIAFLEKIPWASAGSGDLIPNSEMIDFSEPHCLRAARNPHAPGHESRKGLDGRFLSLTFCGEKGHALVVDTVRGTIIEWDGVDSLGRGLESIACIFLDKIYHRYLSLEEIPFELEILLPKPRVVARLADGSRQYEKDLKWILVRGAAEVSGWPNKFKMDDFKVEAAKWVSAFGLNDSSSDEE